MRELRAVSDCILVDTLCAIAVATVTLGYVEEFNTLREMPFRVAFAFLICVESAFDL